MWTLLLSRQSDSPGVFLDRRQVDSGQIKIGRSAQSCDWVIADENGHISREHCTISAIGLDLFVIDTSTNGVALNDPAQRIAPQMPVAIRVRDRLLLGDYVIEVATDSAAAGVALTPPPPPPLPASSGFGQPDQWFAETADPVWGVGQDHAEVHEFLGDAMHDFLAPAGSGQAMAPLGGGADWGGPLSDAFSKPILATLPQVENAFAIPEDWAAPSSPSPSVGAAPDPFAAFPAAPDPFGAPPVPPTDPFAAFAMPPDAPLPDNDPFAGFGEEAPPPPPAKVERTMFEPHPPGEAGAPPPAPVKTPAAPPSQPDAAGWEAFCQGAELDTGDLRLSPDAMRRLGVFYRQVVLGLTDLIHDRAAFKNEFRVERTQLSIGQNNPLKHLPALDSAKLLLGDPLPGFMGAEDAVRAAFEDVKKHQMAMLAGVQHALHAVFERLSPLEIERVMKKAAGTKRSLPFGRGINPWTVYQAVFEALRSDATSNVNSVMSVAFREGYEKFLNAGS